MKVYYTNMLSKPLICRKSHADTPKCHNSKDTNFRLAGKELHITALYCLYPSLSLHFSVTSVVEF